MKLLPIPLTTLNVCGAEKVLLWFTRSLLYYSKATNLLPVNENIFRIDVFSSHENENT